MESQVGRRRSWHWAALLLLVVALAQACGGDSSKSTGPSGGTEIRLALRGVELSQLAAGCTGRLTATRPGFAPRSADIPPSGVVTLLLAPGDWTFTVEIVCVKAGGVTETRTASINANVGGGGLTLNFPTISVNTAPTVSASCSSPVNVGAPSSCTCSASDPDPGDNLSISWSATGGSLSTTSGSSTQFSSSTAGTFDVICAVSDGKATRAATAQVTVGAGTFTLTGTKIGGNADLSLSPAPLEGPNPCPGVPSGTPCSVTYPAGTVVTITATVNAPGTVFSGWGGDCSANGTNPVCTLTMNTNHSFTATFQSVGPPPPPPPPPALVTLTVTVTQISTGGTITSSPAGISCTSPATCSANFPVGTVVTLTKTSGSFSGGWGGACASFGFSVACTLTLTGNTSASASLF